MGGMAQHGSALHRSLALAIGLAVVACVATTVAIAAVADGAPTRMSILVVGSLLTVGMGLLMTKLALRARRAVELSARHSSHLAEVTEVLKRVETDAHIAWRMLKDEHFIDGYALWDEDDRLVDFSGFLARYLPDLADWERPHARQVVEALVDGGHVVLPEGVGREEMIARMCMIRREIPGLREMAMTDGQVFMARTVDLGGNRHACVFTNVTELRTREREIQAAEALFRTAFESGPLIMILLDRDERPIAINRAFTSVLGYPLERFAELGWKGILHPDDGAGCPGTTPWVPVVKRILAADGRVIRGQVRLTPVRDADGHREGRTLITIEDLTSRWEAEERVRYQASLLDQVTNAVMSVDRWGRIVYANRAAHALFQWSQHALAGTPVDRLLGPEVSSVLGHPTAEIETEGLTWTGTRFPALVALARLVDGSGQPVGTVLVATDLTQRRALDMQLMHSARLATLGEMSASIAHEFNQCLHVIRLSSEALRMDLNDGALDLARVGKRADNILAQVDRLTEMVLQMRSMSRREDTVTRFPVQVALDGAIRMAEPLMQTAGIRLVRQGCLADAEVVGHPVRLEQVLLNLLNNARDAIHDRGGTVDGAVTVTCAVADGRVRVLVRDDGTGVPDAVAATLFEPFVTTKDGTRGCGLGLSISRGIAQEMGGSLTFRNHPDGGAEFTVDLPLAGTRHATPLPAPPAEPAPTCEPADDDDAVDEDPAIGGRRLLLVDDEALSVMMVAEYLERQGYAVEAAYDGLEALAKLESDVYDVVITDIRMPRMDGRELIRRLEDLQPGTPVIVMTGHLDEGSQAELGANVVAVLGKPFQPAELRAHLSRLEAANERSGHLEGV